MARIRISPGYRDQLAAHVLTQLAAEKEREQHGYNRFETDICDWSSEHFYIPNTNRQIILPTQQKGVLRYFFKRREDNHRFPFQTLIYSTIKKSGKSTTAGVAARYFAETQTRYGEIFTIGNDLEQAKERSFKEAKRSIEITPGYDAHKEILPGRWIVHAMSLRCIMSGSIIKAIAVDAKGEAGGQQALTVWTELWGAENVEARRFWDEMTPIPTVPDSMRLVETYAGYDGESELLHGLYDMGLDGHQLTAGEFAAAVCREDVPGETFEDFVYAWHETKGDPNVLIPVWANEQASLGMYWDDGLKARRMPWQHIFQPDPYGRVVEPLCIMCRLPEELHWLEEGAETYYRAQEATLKPAAFRRLHLNEWVGAESQFVPMEAWDACGHIHDIPSLREGELTQVVVGTDAAVSGDCFGIVAVSRCPYDSTAVDIRGYKKWDPSESGGQVHFEEPEAFLRAVSTVNNVVQICYDPYQLEDMMQRLRRDFVAWCEAFSQGGDRLKCDSQLYDMVIGKRIHHSNQPDIREHIANANAKLQPNEDSKIRIVKKSTGRKIDLVVALAMASARCLYLHLDALDGGYR